MQWASHPHAATCSMGLFHQSVWFTVSKLTWAAVLPVHYEHSWSFVCGEEKSYLSKLWRKSPLPCVTVSREILGQVIVMCERCHVRHCKWLMAALCQASAQSDLLYIAACHYYTACCLPEELKVHRWIIWKIDTIYRCRTSTLVHYLIIFLICLQPQIKTAIWGQTM